MKLFVTGAGGFIGSAVCRLATERGHQVLGLHRRVEETRLKNCERVTGSLENPPWSRIEQFLPDAVLHLAWTTTPGVNFHSPENVRLIEQSDALFRGLVARGVKHLAGTGTFVEYATSETPLTEDISALAPLYPYSRAKAETLENLRTLTADEGVAWSWFRVFNAFGEGEDRGRMLSAIMLSLSASQPALLKTPDSVRDYIHVSDVARGMVLSLEHGLTGPVNVGWGAGISVFNLACMAADVVDADRNLIHRLTPPGEDLMPVAIADSAKLRTTGWNPRVTLREGLRRLWNSLNS